MKREEEPGRATLYFAERASARLRSVDLATSTVEESFALQSFPKQMTADWDCDPDSLYLLESLGSVLVLDLVSKTSTKLLWVPGSTERGDLAVRVDPVGVPTLYLTNVGEDGDEDVDEG